MIGRDSVVGGTYEYLAPEAMAGIFREDDEAKLARETQDAYALGVTAYQLATRDTTPPFEMKVCRRSVFSRLLRRVQRDSRFGLACL